MQLLAQGKIRQIGVLSEKAYATADLAAIQTIADALETDHMPISVVYGADFSGEDLTTMDDLRARTERKVSVVIAADEDFVCAIGNALGNLSKAAVHQNIGNIENFVASASGKYEDIYFATGETYSEVPTSLLNTLNTKGYMFMRYHVGLAGSYWNDTPTCVATTNDYCYIENNRVIDKAIRNIRTYLLPKLNSSIEVDPTAGTLSLDVIKYFESLAGRALEEMQRNGELSGFKVTVPPTQDILANSELQINITLVIKGIARLIKVNIGFGKSV